MNGKGVKRPLPGTPVYSSFRPGGAQTVERKPPSRRNRANPPTYGGGTHSFCWWCHQRWKTSALRLAGIVGIQVLSLTACCRGFTPPSASVGITLDRRRAEDGHGGVLLGDSYGCKGKGSKCRIAALGGMCGVPPRGQEAWCRRRGRRRPRNGGDGLSVDGYSFISCCVSWLPGAEAERPLGMLYDRTLLADASSSRRDGFVESGEPPASKTTGTLEAAVGARSEEEVDPVTQAVEGCERSSATDGIASNLTARWANVVNGALAETSQVVVSQRRRQQQDEKISETKRQDAAPAGRRKWSGKGWLGIGASWRAGEGWGGPREDQSLARSASATPEGAVLPANATTSSSFSMGSGGLTVWASGGFDEAVEQASWRVWRGPTRKTAMVELAGEKVDEDEEEATEDTGGGVFSASARAELTLYLLETGATHYEVADASAALFAVEAESALTGVTWRRWRRNLDGLTSNGFSGVGGLLTNFLAGPTQPCVDGYGTNMIPRAAPLYSCRRVVFLLKMSGNICLYSG